MLAQVLEYAPDGKRYGEGSKLDDAVAVLDHIDPARLASFENGTYASNALFDLMWLGRYDDLRTRIRKMDTATSPAIPAIVAAAMLGGPSEGVSEAARQKIDDASRPSVLSGAADVLVTARRYPEASALLFAAAALSSESKLKFRADAISKATVTDADRLPTATPVDVVRKVLAVCTAGPQGWQAKARALFSKRADTKTIDAYCATLHATPSRFSDPLPGTAITDIFLAVARTRVEGSESVGFRVTVESPDQSTEQLFVVREDGAYRVRALTSVDASCEALAMAKSAHKEAASQVAHLGALGRVPGFRRRPASRPAIPFAVDGPFR